MGRYVRFVSTLCICCRYRYLPCRFQWIRPYIADSEYIAYSAAIHQRPCVAHSTVLMASAAIHNHHCWRYDLTSHHVATALRTATAESMTDMGFSSSTMTRARAKVPAMTAAALTATVFHESLLRCIVSSPAASTAASSLFLSRLHCHNPMNEVTR